MREPIRDPKWLTETGVRESVQAVGKLVAVALNDPEQFLALVQPWHRAHPRPWSPLEVSVVEGMGVIGMHGEEPEQTEEVRRLLKAGDFSIPEIVAAASFGFEGIGANGLVNPAERLFLDGAVSAIMNHAKAGVTQAAAMHTIEDEVTHLSPFREFLTPQGRVRVCVESAIEIIRHRPQLLAEVLQEIENGSGLRGWIKSGPSHHSRSVAQGLRVLLQSG